MDDKIPVVKVPFDKVFIRKRKEENSNIGDSAMEKKSEKKTKKNNDTNTSGLEIVEKSKLEIEKTKSIKRKTEGEIPFKKNKKIVQKEEDDGSDEDYAKEDAGFGTQCRPVAISSILHEFTEKQKEDIHDIGFGGLLSISMGSSWLDLRMNRDVAVMVGYHLKHILEMKEKVQANVDVPVSDVPDSDDSFYGSEGFLKYMIEVENGFKKMMKVADDMPSYKLLPDYDDEAGGDNVGQEVGGQEGKSQDEVAEALNLSHSKIKANIKWQIGDEVGYVSDFITKNSKLLIGLKREEKEVIDYLMYEGLNDENNVFAVNLAGLKNHFITKKDILSLSPMQKIWSSVIDCWAIILNYTSHSDRNLKFFWFDLGHSIFINKIIYGDEESDADGTEESDVAGVEHVFGTEDDATNEEKIVQCWKNWVDNNAAIDINVVDMFFVPIQMNDHYVAAAVNFKA